MIANLSTHNRIAAFGIGVLLACGLTSTAAYADPQEEAASSGIQQETTAVSSSSQVEAIEAENKEAETVSVPSPTDTAEAPLESAEVSSSTTARVVVPGSPEEPSSSSATTEKDAEAKKAEEKAKEEEAKAVQALAVLSLIDQYQTKLNEANEDYDKANAAYEEAKAAVTEAEKKVEEQTARVEELQKSLNQLAVEMYKRDDREEYLALLLGKESFEQMITAWEAMGAITGKNAELVSKAKEARKSYEVAKETLRVKTDEAEQQRQAAADAQAQAASVYASLMDEVARLTGDVMLDASSRELVGDAAQQAEMARKAAEEALKRAGSKKSTSGTFLENPCPEATDSSGFGYREFDNSFHAGLDMAAAEGTPYYAAESGTVIYATNDGSDNGGAGNWVVISHGNGLTTKYMHSLTTLVQPGDKVVRGQLIGLVGNTGQSFGAHLHFQVEMNGSPIDPRSFI